MYKYTLLLFALLAACASPQERCIREAQKPLNLVLQERQKIGQDLARGYREVREWESYQVFTKCEIGKDRYVPCWDTRERPVTRRLSIDPIALKARDAQLAKQIPSLQKTAEKAVLQCPAPDA